MSSSGRVDVVRVIQCSQGLGIALAERIAAKLNDDQVQEILAVSKQPGGASKVLALLPATTRIMRRKNRRVQPSDETPEHAVPPAESQAEGPEEF